MHSAPAPELVQRFVDDFVALGGDVGDRIGLAVSGGPDSLALLLLAHAAKLNIEAATVDHGIRPEAGDEARFVATVCGELGIRHEILALDRTGMPVDEAQRDLQHSKRMNQAQARDLRYSWLKLWCGRRKLSFLLTAHHADDQAETLLLRLARGSGVRGLSSIRPHRLMETYTSNPQRHEAGQPWNWPWTFRLVRPLLRFTKAELAALVSDAGLTPVDDPSNDDEHYDRTHARRLLAAAPWLRPDRLSAVADHMRDAERALDWAAWEEFNRRASELTDMYWELDPTGLPDELLRRVVHFVMGFVHEKQACDRPYVHCTGPELTRFVERLRNRQTSTLAGIRGVGGDRWHFSPAPPRRASTEGSS